MTDETMYRCKSWDKCDYGLRTSCNHIKPHSRHDACSIPCYKSVDGTLSFCVPVEPEHSVDTTTRPQQLANDHADWLFDFVRKVYVDAFVHGYGHGHEDATREPEPKKEPKC